MLLGYCPKWVDEAADSGAASGEGALSSIPDGQESWFEKREEAGALRLRKYCEQIIPK